MTLRIKRAYRSRPEIAEAHATEAQRRREAEPEKVRARVAARVLPSQPCEIDAPHRGRIERHHPFGYIGDMALAVWFVCQGHHAGMHAAMER